MKSSRLGKEVIKKELSLIPKSPGVYRMINHKGDILYVGKAKNLPNRLKNYVSEKNHIIRTERMLSLTHNLEVTTTNNSTKRESRKTTLPKDFKPTDENLEWAVQKRPDLDLASVTENFILYAETHSTKYVNWQSAWKKWIKMERQNDKIAKISPHARSQENTDRGRKNIAAVLERRATGISTD